MAGAGGQTDADRIELALPIGLCLIGFSLAHFWQGFTGLTVTVLSIATLALLMHLTGRLKWSQVLRAQPKVSYE